VPIFIERYLLPTLAAMTIALVFLNPMKFDWTQRITGGLAVLFFAYFLAHTLHSYNQASTQSADKRATSTSTIEPAKIEGPNPAAGVPSPSPLPSASASIVPQASKKTSKAAERERRKQEALRDLDYREP